MNLEPIILEGVTEEDQKLCPKLGIKSEGCEEFEKLCHAVLDSIRLGEITKLEDDRGVYFEHTYSYQDYAGEREFFSQKMHKEEMAIYANQIGLLSSEQTDDVINPKSKALQSSAFKRLNADAAHRHPWFVQHINNFMNFVGFNALVRTYKWVFRDDDPFDLKLESNDLLADYYKHRLEGKIDEFNQDRSVIVPTAEKAQEALDWLVDNYQWWATNSDYLAEVVAQINIRSASRFRPCSLSESELLELLYEVKPLPSNLRLSKDQVAKITPTVVSLYSRELYFGEEIAFPYGDKSYTVTEINRYISYAKAVRKELGSLKTSEKRIGRVRIHDIYKRAKPVLSDNEIVTWNKRIQKFDKFEEALTFWSNKIHAIGHDFEKELDPENPPYVAFEEQIELLGALIKFTETIDNWIEEGVMTHLFNQAEQAQQDKLKSKIKEHILDASTTSKDTLSDDERLIVQKLKEFDSKKLGVNQTEVMQFYRCVDIEKTFEWSAPATKAMVKAGLAKAVGQKKSEEVNKVVPLDAESFVTKIFYKDHGDKRTKPILAHEVYQDFLFQLPEHCRKKAKNGDHYVKQPAKNQRGADALAMAKWMLKNLPTATEEELQIYRSDELLKQR